MLAETFPRRALARRTMFALVGLLLLVALGACDSTPPVEVRGWVYGDGPIVGANVTLLSLDGTELGKSDEPTGELGTFRVEAKELPESFRIVANGGSMQGQLFAGELAAMVDGFAPASEYVGVNVLTTLVETYRREVPGLASDDAKGQVLALLEVPTYIDIRDHAYVETQQFSSATFFVDAAVAGGLGAFVTSLVEDVRDGLETQRPFLPVESNSAASDKVKEAAAEELAGVAIEYAVRYGLLNTGITDPPD